MQESNGASALQDAPIYYGRGGKFTAKPRVVVLGSGWAAMSFIKSLSKRQRCPLFWNACKHGALGLHGAHTCMQLMHSCGYYASKEVFLVAMRETN